MRKLTERLPGDDDPAGTADRRLGTFSGGGREGSMKLANERLKDFKIKEDD